MAAIGVLRGPEMPLFSNFDGIHLPNEQELIKQVLIVNTMINKTLHDAPQAFLGILG